MPVRITLDDGRVPVKIFTDDIEAEARQQLVNVAKLPIVHGHVAAMPDVHAGIGATVGSVIPTLDAVIPAAVGVDIGCGMNAVRLTLGAAELPDKLGRVRGAIEDAVPVGFEQHKSVDLRSFEREAAVGPLHQRLTRIVKKHGAVAKMQRQFDSTWLSQIGTLGGGNHFIELCHDEENRVWAMLHSGSRGIGNVLGRYFIEKAKDDMARQHVHLPDRDLAYLCEGSALFDDYVEAVEWAQDYALVNRREMLRLVIGALRKTLPAFELDGEAVDCHHNYVARETHLGRKLFITRKGAISAKDGELGIIPGSMGARSYIVRGRGNPESFTSCAHGAGRRMSRAEARRRFNPNDLRQQTAGVECRKDTGVIDEIPAAYKDIDAVMAHQQDLVDVVHTLKQVVCVKG
jgi:tRNA-splicing ligase RtcB